MPASYAVAFASRANQRRLVALVTSDSAEMLCRPLGKYAPALISLTPAPTEGGLTPSWLLTCSFSEMAARAGIEPGQSMCPSLARSVPASGYESKYPGCNLDFGAPSGELFTVHAPQTVYHGLIPGIAMIVGKGRSCNRGGRFGLHHLASAYDL